MNDDDLEPAPVSALLAAPEPEVHGLAALRAEVRELELLTRVLVEMLEEKGLLDADEVRARLANAKRPKAVAARAPEGGPYRGGGVFAEPPPPGTVACARCGTFVAERKVFTNADGRFCRDCFEPG